MKNPHTSPRLHAYRTRHTRQREQRMSRIDSLFLVLLCVLLMTAATLWSIGVQSNMDSYTIMKKAEGR